MYLFHQRTFIMRLLFSRSSLSRYPVLIAAEVCKAVAVKDPVDETAADPVSLVKSRNTEQDQSSLPSSSWTSIPTTRSVQRRVKSSTKTSIWGLEVSDVEEHLDSTLSTRSTGM